MHATEKPQGNVIIWIIVAIILLLIIWLGLWWHRPTSVAVCGPSDLQLSMGGSEGTAGTIYKHAVVTNIGNRTCTLTGYPAAFLLNGSGGVLGRGAAANPLFAPSVVTLAPGAKAHTVLGFPDAGNFGPGICTADSAKLELFVPGAVSAIQTAWSDQNCPGFSVTAFQAGA